MAIESVARVLGGPTTEGHAVRSEVDLALAVENGLLPSAVDGLSTAMQLDAAEFEKLLMPKRTWRHRRERAQLLTADESDRAARLARVWVRTLETLGNEDKARVWLRRPNRSMKGRSPIDLLDTGSGAIVVENVLTRIAYGVFE